MSSVLEKLKGVISSLVGIPTLPKSVRNVLKQYGDANITAMRIRREPLSKVAEGLLTAVTLGKWKEIKGSYDKMFHLYAILYTDKGNFLLEKNETVILKKGTFPLKKEAEEMTVSMPQKIPLAEFINRTIKRMGLSDYTTYEGFSLNCQNFLMNHLQANNLITPQLKQFIWQDTKQLIEKTPSFSRWLGKAITDIAGKGRELVEEVIYKKGGTVMGPRQKRRHIG